MSKDFFFRKHQAYRLLGFAFHAVPLTLFGAGLYSSYNAQESFLKHAGFASWQDIPAYFRASAAPASAKDPPAASKYFQVPETLRKYVVRLAVDMGVPKDQAEKINVVGNTAINAFSHGFLWSPNGPVIGVPQAMLPLFDKAVPLLPITFRNARTAVPHNHAGASVVPLSPLLADPSPASASTPSSADQHKDQAVSTADQIMAEATQRFGSMSKDAMDFVLAHELAHLRSNHAALAALNLPLHATLFYYTSKLFLNVYYRAAKFPEAAEKAAEFGFTNIKSIPAAFRPFKWGALFGSLLCSLPIVALYSSNSRSLEFSADSTAAAHSCSLANGGVERMDQILAMNQYIVQQTAEQLVASMPPGLSEKEREACKRHASTAATTLTGISAEGDSAPSLSHPSILRRLERIERIVLKNC